MPGQIHLSNDQETVTARTAPLPAELLGQPAADVAAKALDSSCAGFGTATGQSWCWAGVGTDNSVRTVVARYGVAATTAATVNDVVDQLYFNVPAP